MTSQDAVPQRPDHDSYGLSMADAAALRADCTRRRVGCVIFSDDHRVVSTGYNGAVSGMPGCASDGACPRGAASYEQVAGLGDYDRIGSPGFCIAVHAEANALLYARNRSELKGATAYITDPPCPSCRKLLAASGVARAVWPAGQLCGVSEMLDFSKEL